MKRVYVLIFIGLMIAFMLCVNNVKSQALNDIAYDITRVEIAGNSSDNEQLVGEYIIRKENNLSLDFNGYKYISFKISKDKLDMLIDLLNIHIVKKYNVFDNIVYDCKFNNVANNYISTLQIAIEKEVKIGIPTIFEGF